MKIAKNSDTSVATTAAFDVVVEVPGDGYVHALSCGADVAANDEIEISSISCGGHELIPSGGNAVPWSVLITRNGTQLLELFKSVQLKGGGNVRFQGTNQNGSTTKVFCAVWYGKNPL